MAETELVRHQRVRAARYAAVMLVVSTVLIVGTVVVNVAYTRHVQAQSDRRWCDLMDSLDQPSVPATSERGRRVQQQIHRLRLELGCAKK